MNRAEAELVGVVAQNQVISMAKVPLARKREWGIKPIGRIKMEGLV